MSGNIFHGNELSPDEMPPGEVAKAEEAAFREVPEFLSRELEPYSFVRKTAALALGLRFGRLSPDDITYSPNPDFIRKTEAEEELAGVNKRLSRKGAKWKGGQKEEAETRQRVLMELIESLKDAPAENSSYDGVLMDAAIILWLCSMPDSVCQRARRKPSEYESKIDRWAEDNGIGGVNMRGALDVFQAIMEAERVSHAEPDIKEEEKAGKPRGESPGE